MLSILDTLHVTCSWDMQKEGSEDTDSACGEDKKVREEVGNSKACRLVAGAIYVTGYVNQFGGVHTLCKTEAPG